uniref:Integrase catalytic domain-containing protein n=1 Tax=Peronospora matthiolae TaxID=2874970 RepID=A0AAV1UZQ8_9STRA
MKRDCQERTIDGDEDAVFAVSTERVNGWLIDSGATAHMIPHRSDLFEYENVNSGIEVTIDDGKKLAIAKGKKVGKAYIFKCEQEGARFIQYAEAGSKWELWHARMGHLNQDALIKTRHATNGIPAIDQPTLSLCGGCMKGKQTVATFPHCSSSKTSRVLELVHTDVMGPMTNPSKGGANYVLTFVDDYARYVVTYFLKKKSEVAIKLSEFMNFYENQWGERMKCLRPDNRTEFVNQ